MTKEQKEEAIDAKCDQAGCDDKARARHRNYFVNERWDVHPPPDFEAYFDEQPKPPPSDLTPKRRLVAWWNSDLVRQDFYKWRGEQL